MKTTKQKKIKSGRITGISVSKLYNLGNYQNVKYELSASVGPGESADLTLRLMVGVLKDLRPIRVPSCREELLRALKKEEKDLTNWEKEHMPAWAQEVKAYELALLNRDEAVRKLDQMGGTGTHVDAKRNWSADDDTPY